MTTTSELRSKLETKGEEISQIAHQIEDRIESYFDWKGAVRQYPMQSIGVAALTGLVLSGSTGRIARFIFGQALRIGQAAVTAAVVTSITAHQQQEDQQEDLLPSQQY